MYKNTLNYKDSGVDIKAGNEFVKKIAPLAKSTFNKNVMEGLGGFCSVVKIPKNKYKNPLMVSCTDGVGTKLKLAIEFNKHKNIGIDLVAMCVNDMIVCGAQPIYFLDYYATGKLDQDIAVDVIKGIVKACKESNCSLVGGETAEMSGLYNNKDYDLAGFCVGLVDEQDLITKKKVNPKDIIIGISSSGLHSNGYSLIRKIISKDKINLDKNYNFDKKLGDILLTPTKIYVDMILKLIKKFNIHALSHITGGGLTENIPRVLPNYTTAKIVLNSWKQHDIFKWVQEKSKIDKFEMLNTFNCGIGMIIIINPSDKNKILQELNNFAGNKAWEIGYIEECLNILPSVQYI